MRERSSLPSTGMLLRAPRCIEHVVHHSSSLLEQSSYCGGTSEINSITLTCPLRSLISRFCMRLNNCNYNGPIAITLYTSTIPEMILGIVEACLQVNIMTDLC